ncbi:hypothetical protein EIP91_011827 [Steccherinum ochraceum]|uniref:G-protein coupled receptors family 1 profile domain-containing protein n=1 Tax=Steccherinum ochraceum TaxID=92696 RepID=A0A4R0RLN6_9APHY|nr:hypothetical protein EIP91_011827 [Steccherinum ochraceum]
MDLTATTDLNLSIPQTYLSTDVVIVYEAQSHVFFLVLGAWFWDFANALPEEFRIIWWRKPTAATLCYILSRFMTLAAILSAVIFQVAPTTDCNLAKDFLFITMTCATSFTALLFIFRVRAVYAGSVIPTAILAVIWLSMSGISSVTPAFVGTAHIGPTRFCILTDVRVMGSTTLTFTFLALYDTLVFILLSWKLTGAVRVPTTETSWWESATSFFHGHGLPRFSRAVLRHGQKYYLATVILNILALVMLATPTVPLVLHTIFVIPAIAMQNAIACRVFRETLLDIASVNSQRLDIGHQSSLQIRHDIDLSDMMSRNGHGIGDSSDKMSSINPV